MKKASKYVLLLVITLCISLASCKKKCFVEFNLDGGIANYSTIEVDKNNAITKPDNPIKEGYIFKGFELDGIPFSFDTKIVKNITLVATWEKLHTIIFNDGSKDISIDYIENGKNIARPDDPKLENAQFLGWYLNNELFDFDQKVTTDIMLVAKWRNQYIISFDTNGGSTINDKVVEEGSKVTQPFDPKLENANFLGWYLNDVLFDFNTEITSNITLVAKWSNNYQVSFDTDGGSYIPPRIAEEGKTIIRPGNPTKENYIFLGWYLNDQEFTFEPPITNNITLTAKWKEKYHQVIFDSGSPETTIQRVEDGQKIVKPADPVQENKTFLGWYLNDELFNFKTAITENITLVAKFKDDYKVTFHFNNGSEDLVCYIKDNKLLSSLFTFDEPTKEGYVLLDYCLNEELTIVLYSFNRNVTADMDIYVAWSKQYYITYHLDGGVCEDLIEQYSEISTKNVSLILKTPKKEGYYFRGYYQNSDFTGERFYKVDKGVVSDYELYAKWEIANLKNAYISFLGDSISTYKGYIPNGYTYFYSDIVLTLGETWWKMTQEQLGCKLGINNSYSGTCVLKRYGPNNSSETLVRLEKCRRHDQINPDILVVYMGMNDVLVNPAEVTVDEFNTAYHNMINNIYSLYPDVQLFICTLGYEVNYRTKPNLEQHLLQKEAFNKVIADCAKEYNIPLIDFASAFSSTDYLVDTVHPNASGMIELSKIAVKTIKEYYENKNFA